MSAHTSSKTVDIGGNTRIEATADMRTRRVLLDITTAGAGPLWHFLQSMTAEAAHDLGQSLVAVSREATGEQS